MAPNRKQDSVLPSLSAPVASLLCAGRLRQGVAHRGLLDIPRSRSSLAPEGR